MSFEFGRVKDSRGSFFFLIDHSGIAFGRFGHVEWSPRASDEVVKFEPESWGLVAIIDPTRAQVVSN